MNRAPTLETPRLILRPWRDADIEAWAAMNADPRVMEFFPSLYDRARSEATASAMRAGLERNGYGWWVTELKRTSRFAGVVVLDDVSFEAPFAPARQVGWRFLRDAWGSGYATEGARAALTYAFETLGWDEVVALTATVNLRSQRVMQRLGMRRDPAGDFLHPAIAEGHRLRPHVLYRIRKS
ncbi:MAG: GNAT family N-acetyltransferase [Vulcanimicrobiaceae bacterium]